MREFADRYFDFVNTRYRRPKRESLPMLFWDAYRNGGLHNYFPKQHTITTAAGARKVAFGLSWAEHGGAGGNRSPTLEEMQAARAGNPASGGPGLRHLDAEVQPGELLAFWVCAPILALELIDSGDKWATKLESRRGSATVVCGRCHEAGGWPETEGCRWNGVYLHYEPCERGRSCCYTWLRLGGLVRHPRRPWCAGSRKPYRDG